MKNPGVYAFLSGLMGIAGYGFLFGYLISRSENTDTWILMNRLHDAACASQFLLLVPVVFAMHFLLRKNNFKTKQITLIIGIASALATSLCLLLIFPKVVSDIFYMIPQGLFGIWIIAINWRRNKFISNALRIFGIIVGIGLLITGLFPTGFALFISIDAVRIPAVPMKEFPQTQANNILHIFLFAGFFTGVLTLPPWTMMLGKALIKKHSIS